MDHFNPSSVIFILNTKMMRLLWAFDSFLTMMFSWWDFDVDIPMMRLLRWCLQASMIATCSFLSNISLLFSNMNGPSHPVSLGNNPISKLAFTASGLPVVGSSPFVGFPFCTSNVVMMVSFMSIDVHCSPLMSVCFHTTARHSYKC